MHMLVMKNTANNAMYIVQELHTFHDPEAVVRRCSVKKGVLRNSAKFTGKHLRPATLLKKRLWHRCFPVKFAKFLRTPFFTEHLWWLLLIIIQ